jgi:hypothetical protein
MIDLITDFMDCLCQVILGFIAWDPKVSTIAFILLGYLLGEKKPAKEPQSSYSTR